MFLRSPFDPIEDVVAEAKQERAQLDRLLTLSTPRERALIALTALVVVLFGAWLLFGDVSRNLAIKGVLLVPGEQDLVSSISLRGVVWLPAGAAQEVKVGMPAVIEVELAEGTARSLEGTIATLVSVPLPDRLAPADPGAPLTMREIEIVLADSPGFDVAGALECRVVVDLGERSPAALFGLRPS